jgi:hypothetical protein
MRTLILSDTEAKEKAERGTVVVLRPIKLDGFDPTDPLYETKDGDIVPVIDMCPWGHAGDTVKVKESWGISSYWVSTDERLDSIVFKSCYKNPTAYSWRSPVTMPSKYAREAKLKEVDVVQVENIRYWRLVI